MCGRFGLAADRDVLEAYYDAACTFDYEPRYNIAPKSGVPAVRGSATDAIDRLQWGLVPHWADDADDSPTLINARAETLAEKPAFRDAFANRRCLVPATNFYEWTGRRGRRVPYCIRVEDRPLFSMAGVWEPSRGNSADGGSLAIVTTAANDTVGELHDRMPAILDGDDETRWLEAADEAALLSLLEPYPDRLTERFEVSTAVNDPASDGPELVEPVGSNQADLREFG
ncbi:MAG: SOS response-associated peptidase [Halobacteriales archaeon]